MELYRKDTSCIEVLLHPLLRTLEVDDKNIIRVDIRLVHEKLLTESQKHDHSKMFHFDLQTDVRKGVLEIYLLSIS